MRTSNKEIDNRVTYLLIVVILAVLFACFYVGTIVKQNEIEARIWPHQKDCYNEQDLEIIVFGEIQE